MSALKRRLVLAPLWAAVTGVLGGAFFVFAATAASSLMAFAALGGLLVVAAVLAAPEIGFFLTSLVIPVERLGRLTPDSSMYTISLMRIMGTITLVSLLVHVAIKRWRLEFGAAFAAYAGYFGIVLLGLFHTGDFLGTVRASGAILGNLLFFFLVVNLVRDWRTAKIAVVIWLASTTLVGAYTIYDWHFGQGVSEAQLGEMGSRFSTVMEDTSEWRELDTVARAAGPTSHSAVYGINLLLTLPFFFYFWRVLALRWQRLGILAAGLVVFYNIMLTNTRATILLAAVVVIWCGVRKFYRITAGQLVAAMMLGTALLAVLPPAIYERVLDVSNYTYERSETLRIRLEYWSAGLQIAQENWLVGIGVGNQQEVPKYLKGVAPDETTVHNEYLMTLMEVGVIGWLLFFGFVWMVMRANGKVLSFWRGVAAAPEPEQYWFLAASRISLFSVLIYGLQVDVFHFPLKGWWLVAGITWAMYRMSRSNAVAGG